MLNKIIVIIFFCLPLPNIYAQENTPFNPFKQEYRSLLDYNRFKTFNQITFSSINSKYYSKNYGSMLNSLQYSINPKMDLTFHLGKTFDFNKRENTLNFNRKEDYLLGGTFIYKINPDLKMGVEYGDTPTSMNQFNFYHPNFTIDKNAKFWLNKKFGHTDLDVYINYLEIKPSVE